MLATNFEVIQSTIRGHTGASMNDAFDIVNVTPQQAKEWLENNDFERQRPLREHHVLSLAEEMDAGNFIAHSAIVFARCGDKNYLIDGQHRLNAIVLSDKSVEMTILTKQASSMEQIERWYASIDQGLKRSTRDAIKAQNLHSEIGLSERHAGRMSAAVRLIASGFVDGGKGYTVHARSRSNIVISDLMKEWPTKGSDISS
jgi:hypothetical protein